MGFLVNLEVAGRPALVVGGGAIAARKIAALVDAGADVTVVAPEVGEPVAALERDGRIRVLRRAFEPGDARGAFVVVGATNDDEVNREVAQDARACGALVNIVDRPALCTYTVPAVVRRGHLTVAVATDGRCPSVARAIRERLDREFGPEYAEVVDRLGALRQTLMAAGWTSDRINRAVGSLLDAGLAAAIADGDDDRAAGMIASVVDEARGVR